MPAGVALLAGCRNMCTGQWEIGLIVVKACVPVRCSMASLAGRGEPGGCMIGIIGVVVVGFMASEALAGCSGELSVDMALLAVGRQMCSG